MAEPVASVLEVRLQSGGGCGGGDRPTPRAEALWGQGLHRLLRCGGRLAPVAPVPAGSTSPGSAALSCGWVGSCPRLLLRVWRLSSLGLLQGLILPLLLFEHLGVGGLNSVGNCGVR